MYCILSRKMRQMYKQLHILLSYSLYWQYAGEKWLIKNRGFEDDRFERRTLSWIKKNDRTEDSAEKTGAVEE